MSSLEIFFISADLMNQIYIEVLCKKILHHFFSLPEKSTNSRSPNFGRLNHFIMKADRTGIILYVHRYQECVNFYRDVLKLEIMFATDALTCFALGAMYLMVEVDDENPLPRTPEEGNRSCIRINVANVKEYAERLAAKGIEHTYGEFAWGTIAKFYDPDGNLLAFKDSEKFEKQIKEAQQL